MIAQILLFPLFYYRIHKWLCNIVFLNGHVLILWLHVFGSHLRREHALDFFEHLIFEEGVGEVLRLDSPLSLIAATMSRK